MGKTYLAIDLGAESGRAILGQLQDGKLSTEEVHRFPNKTENSDGRLRWDFPSLMNEVHEGIRKAAAQNAGRLDGIAVDSWGVDYGLLDENGLLVENPVHYRDEGHAGEAGRFTASIMSREELFSRTGVQLIDFNTLFQLTAQNRLAPDTLGKARHLLHIGDLVACLLGGRPASELTIASTSQLIGSSERTWDLDLARKAGLPAGIFGELVEPGTVTGEVKSEVARKAGLTSPCPVIAAASHDTASAVASCPATEPGGWAYLSSGTWSLLGIETTAPILSGDALEQGFTNEAGAFGRNRFLAIITGLWLVQECRRQWSQEGMETGYEELARMAEDAPPARSFIDPDDPVFSSPGDMPARIREACLNSSQEVPGSREDILRCIIESLARKYAAVVRAAGGFSPEPISRLHVIGGGSRNSLLNRLTARELGIPLVAGPVEATSKGNILLQALATGEIAGIEELRQVSAASTEIRYYEPT
ncbi:MAG: rhamnulokinase family protein [Planctomycetota bacterium]